MESSADSEINSSKKVEEPSKQNASDLCRLCAIASIKLMPIFNGEGLVHNISEKLEKYLPIIKVMESDELPLHICYQCASTLLSWHKLYEGCSRTDQRLRGILTPDENFSDEMPGNNDFGDDTDFDLRVEDGKADPRMEIDEINASDTGEDRSKFDDNIDEIGTGDVGRSTAEKKNINTVSNSDNITCKCSQEDRQECSLCVGVLSCNFRPVVFTSKRKIENHLLTSYASDTCPTNHIEGNSDSHTSKRSKKMMTEKGKETFSLPKSSQCNKMLQSRCDSMSKDFKCRICSKICSTARGLLRHGVVHKHKVVATSCNYCAESFSDNDARQTHVIKYHRIKSTVTSPQVDIEPQGFLKVESSSFEISTDANNEPDMEQKNINESEATADEIFETKVLNCPECSESFDQKQMLIVHQQMQHNKTDEFACEHCDKKFTDNKLLKQHLSRSHRKRKIKNSDVEDPFVRWYIYIDGKKYLKCDQCKYNSLWHHKSRFSEHYRIHTGEKPFTCDSCQKQFRTKTLLTKHVMFVHEGIKEFPCTICGRRFSDKRYVIEHTRIHTNERPYVCDLCGKSFRQSASLFVHKELHKGLRKFHCDRCPSKFTTRSSLNMHIKRHTGERNFICATCGKAFVDGKHLRDHMTVHSEERPFACKLCDRKFKLLKHLKQHGRTHKQELISPT